MVQYPRLLASPLTPGTLYIVSTPIGNLEDITYRAVRTLADCNLIAAEDTRRAAKLLTHYGITTKRLSLHRHNELQRIPALLKRLSNKESIALISDAGTPLVSDPGQHLTRAAFDDGIRIEAIPGPSAVLSSLAVSGMDANGFTFVGFPPYRSNDRKKFFKNFTVEPRTIVFFEAPHRLRASLSDLYFILGNRHIAVCHEMTKVHESLVIGPINSVLEELVEIKGEYTIVLDAPRLERTAGPEPGTDQIISDFDLLTKYGATRRQAIRELATKYRQRSRDVYQIIEESKQ